MRHRGFTLIELAVAAATLAVLLTIALPAFQDRLAEGRRADATHALERIQIAQERYRSAHGLYASQLQPLGSSGTSPEGLYEVRLDTGKGDSYTAVARVRADGPQANDTACGEITLRVDQGFATLGPAPRCWNR